MKYFVMPESVTVEETVYPTYAIVSPSGQVAHDVTTNPEEAKKIAQMFEENGLSPIHFLDAIDDYLAS